MTSPDPPSHTRRAVRTPTVTDVEIAWRTIGSRLVPSPVDHGGGQASAGDPVLKLESLQPTGSFKVRGALNALAQLDPAVRVVTASAGNHGLGLAYAAQLLGRQATVVVSTKASPAKVSRLRTFGVELVQIGDSFDDAEQHALALAGQGAHYVSAYNDPDVIAGQATIGYELSQQLGEDLTIVCSVGGGGLAAGLGLWASTRPAVRVIGVESEQSTAVSQTMRSGADVVEVGDTLADGMAGNIEAGCVTPAVIARHVAELVTVSEDEIRTGLRYLAVDRGYVAEGAGAVAVAALLAGKVAVRGQAVAIVSGRNITMPTLAAALA
jgi:threonine dehydratase